MPKARKSQISLADTPYYHCVSRCVRRAYLCGKDKHSGQSYEHRRGWVEDRILFLSTVFAIDVCAYAVMSNHTHVVLHVNQDEAKHWSDETVLLRWHRLYRGTLLTQQFVQPALQPALAGCMAYVDLNPIRAKMAKTPETSQHTSICRRIKDAKKGYQPNNLMPFVSKHKPEGLPFHLKDYIQLIEQTGKVLQADKRGAIPLNEIPILERLGLNESIWCDMTRQFETQFKHAAGSEWILNAYKHNHGLKRMPGISTAKRLSAVN